MSQLFTRSQHKWPPSHGRPLAKKVPLGKPEQSQAAGGDSRTGLKTVTRMAGSQLLHACLPTRDVAPWNGESGFELAAYPLANKKAEERQCPTEEDR